MLKRITTIAFLAGLLASAGAHTREDPVKAIGNVTSGGGGSNDNAAQSIDPAMSVALWQAEVIDNRASGVIPRQVFSGSAMQLCVCLSCRAALDRANSAEDVLQLSPGFREA